MAATSPRRRTLRVALAALAAALLAVVLLVFEPQTLLLDTRVDDAFPGPSGAAEPAAGAEVPDATEDPITAAGETATPRTTESPAEPTRLASGAFVSRDHTTTGTATVFALEDGTRVLRFEDLATDNGPDLKVYLSTAAPDAPGGDFDTEFVDLGVLAGNLGNQNYVVPAEVDLSRFRSVVIWCDRFDVPFGAAPLAS